MLNDKDVKIDENLLNIFLSEATTLLERLNYLLDDYQETSEKECFEDFAIKIELLITAAKNLNFNELAELATLGQELASKCKNISEMSKLLAIHSLLSQLLKNLEKLVKGFQKRVRLNPDELLKHRLITANYHV